MRLEKDSLGEIEVPDEAYYGAQTVRNARNYRISPHTYNEYPEIIRAVTEVKKACALSNKEIGALAAEKADAIVKACDEVIAEKFKGHFPVNVWRSQGTGVNMNVNEVLANRANEILTGHRGYDQVHPNSHVNMCQSSNDVFPTAEAIVLYRKVGKLLASCQVLEDQLKVKAKEFESKIRLGRTGLQDAVPMTWGQVFGSWQSMVSRTKKELAHYRKVFQSVPLGGTAVGTGMGVQPGYAKVIYKNLAETVGFEINRSHFEEEVINRSAVFDAMRNTDHTMLLMAFVKAVVSCGARIANDLILLSSGPRAGLRELTLPEFGLDALSIPHSQPAYVCESVVELFHAAVGIEQMATFAANEGQQDHGSINSGAFIAVCSVMDDISKVLELFANYVIANVQLNEEVCADNANRSGSLSTMVSALFGYPVGVKLAKSALSQNKTCKQVALEEKVVSEEIAEDIFDVRKLADHDLMVELFEKYRTVRNVR